MRYFVILLIALESLSGYGQSGYLQFDKPYYFAGEYLLYNIYLSDIATDSSVVQLRFGREDEVLSTHFNRCLNGSLSGYVKLSHELHSGIYHFQALTFEGDEAKPLEIFTEAVTIIGTGGSELTSYVAFDDAGMVTPLPPILDDVKVSFTSEEGEMMGRVSWNDFAATSVSISVRKKISDQNHLPLRVFSHHLDRVSLMTKMPLVGQRILHIDDQNRSPLLYSCHPMNLQFQLTKVSREGRFTFALDDLYGPHALQFVEFFGFDMDLEIIEPSFKNDPVYIEVLDTQIQAAYQQYQKRKKIFQLYNRSGIQIEWEESVDFNNQIPADFDFDVQDYAIRGTIVDLIREVSSPLKFRKRKNGYEAKVLYEVGDFKYWFSAPPLFIINGIAIHDVAFVSSLVLQEIKRIRIFSKLETLDKVIGGHRIGGLILIDLMDPLFKIPDELYLPRTIISGLQPKIKYPIQMTSDLDIPKIDPLLYWAPRQEMNIGNQFTFTCPVPDVHGEYVIDILARNVDGKTRMGSVSAKLSQRVLNH